jgi:maltooligosyltrehalose trehalohydrolase
MRAEERGFFHLDRDEVPEGQRYFFRLDGQRERADPASLWQPDGVGGPSAVLRTGAFSWTDQDWRGVLRADLVLYELHVGTFTPEGTFAAIIPRLGELRRLGVTAIELMPVGQFPGGRNWGYDGVYPYAVQDSYGGPQGLQKLVDACHATGLAVFLDVIYNHVGPEGNYLPEFGPYFTDRYRTGWGPAFNFDGPGSDAVRKFVIDNARMWIEEYHADGLRLDAVHAVYDLGTRHILRDIGEAVAAVGRREGRHVHVFAESDLNDVRLLVPPEQGGHALDGQWSDDFHHAVHANLTGERQGYYTDFGRPDDLARVLEQPFLFTGQYSRHRDRRHGAPAAGLAGDRFVVCVQNHDQVGNRARGERLGALVSPPAQRLAASLLLLSPYLPLLFMGEEYGEQAPFPFFCSFADERLVEAVRQGRRHEFAAFAWQGEVPEPQDEATFATARLTWSWPEGSARAGLRRLYQDLLAARRAWPALRDFRLGAARLLPDRRSSVLELLRGGQSASADAVQAFFNLTAQSQPCGSVHPGATHLLRSEAACYGGQQTEALPRAELCPYECVVYGPAGWRAFGQLR